MSNGNPENLLQGQDTERELTVETVLGVYPMPSPPTRRSGGASQAPTVRTWVESQLQTIFGRFVRY